MKYLVPISYFISTHLHTAVFFCFMYSWFLSPAPCEQSEQEGCGDHLECEELGGVQRAVQAEGGLQARASNEDS